MMKGLSPSRVDVTLFIIRILSISSTSKPVYVDFFLYYKNLTPLLGLLGFGILLDGIDQLGKSATSIPLPQSGDDLHSIQKGI